MLKAVAYLRGQLHTIKGAYAKTRWTLEVSDVELVRQNTEYTNVLGQLGEERKKDKFKLDEMRETCCRTPNHVLGKPDDWRKMPVRN